MYHTDKWIGGFFGTTLLKMSGFTHDETWPFFPPPSPSPAHPFDLPKCQELNPKNATTPNNPMP